MSAELGKFVIGYPNIISVVIIQSAVFLWLFQFQYISSNFDVDPRYLLYITFEWQDQHTRGWSGIHFCRQRPYIIHSCVKLPTYERDSSSWNRKWHERTCAWSRVLWNNSTHSAVKTSSRAGTFLLWQCSLLWMPQPTKYFWNSNFNCEGLNTGFTCCSV